MAENLAFEAGAEIDWGRIYCDPDRLLVRIRSPIVGVTIPSPLYLN